MRRVLLGCVLLLFSIPATAADESTAAKARKAAAAEVAKYAVACVAAGAKTEGLRAADEAASLDPDAPGLEEARTALEALDGDAGDAESAAKKRRASAGPGIAKAYDRLVAAFGPDDAQGTDALLRAVAWDPKPRVAAVRKRADDATAANRPWEGARLLARLRAADPEGTKAGRHDGADADLGRSGRLMLGSASHPLVAWVGLPKSWKKGGSYPVLIGVEGAGCSFKGYFDGLTASRGSRDVIVLTPISLSNTNALETKTFPMYPKELLDEHRDQLKRLAFDGAGVDAILADLRARFGAEEKTFGTGFSGGGMFTYWRLFRNPERVRGIVPACGNFLPTIADGAPPAPEGGGPAIHLMTGEKDPHRLHTHGDPNQPGIEPQTDLAQQAMERLGYRHVRRTMFPGVGHASLHAKAWEFVDEVLAGKFR